MTEAQARQLIVDAAKSYIGFSEASGKHKKIIDLYNTGQKNLPRGYRVTYSDPWCATFISAMAIQCSMTDIIPCECSCYYQVEAFKKLGEWCENDAHIPNPGDIIYYDWQDSGNGDNTGAPDHVGIVESCDGKTIIVIEGNKNDSVERRTIKVDGRYIRGYGLPNYKAWAKAQNADDPKDEPSEWAKEAWEWAKSKGITDGLRPKENTTRQEVITFLYRYDKTEGKKK